MGKPSLLCAMWRTMRSQFLLMGVLVFLEVFGYLHRANNAVYSIPFKYTCIPHACVRACYMRAMCMHAVTVMHACMHCIAYCTHTSRCVNTEHAQ